MRWIFPGVALLTLALASLWGAWPRRVPVPPFAPVPSHGVHEAAPEPAAPALPEMTAPTCEPGSGHAPSSDSNVCRVPVTLERIPIPDRRHAESESARRSSRRRLADAPRRPKRRPRARRRRPETPPSIARATATAPRPTVLRQPAPGEPNPESPRTLSHRKHWEALDAMRRGLQTSPVAEVEVRNREDHEAALEPHIVESLSRRSQASLLFDGRPRERETVFAPTTRCLRAAAEGPEAARPVRLSCMRDIVRISRAKKDEVILAMDILSMLTGLPLWQNIKELRSRGIHQEAISRILWVTDWLRWVEHAPGRLDEGLTGLSGSERRALRRMLPRWWQKPAYSGHHRTITHIMETRFLAICPNCADAEGMPSRACFKTGWLWARNWLAEAGKLPPETVRQRRARLPEPQREELAALSP